MPDPSLVLSFTPDATVPANALPAPAQPDPMAKFMAGYNAALSGGAKPAPTALTPAPADQPPVIGPGAGALTDANNFLETAADQAIAGVVGLPRALLRAGDFINRNINGAEPGATGHELDTAGSVLPTPEGTFNYLARDSGGIYVPRSEPGKLAQGAVAAALGGGLLGVPAAALPAVGLSGAGSVAGSQLLPQNPELGGVLGGFIAPVGELAARAPVVAGRSVLEPMTRPFAGKPEPLVDPQTGAPVLQGSVTNNPADVEPITAKPGVVQIAAAKLRAAATDPEAAKVALAKALTTQQGAAATDLVPGSLPTTFQVTGDAGLGQFERQAARTNADVSTARDAANNAARVKAVDGQGAPGADPAAVGDLVRNQLDALTKQDQAAISAAKQAVADRVNQSSVVAPGQDGSALQAYGEALRGGAAPNDEAAANLLAARNATKERERSLYAAVDPDGTLTVDMTPIRQKAQDIAGNLPKNAAPLAGNEAGIISTAQALPDVQPFQELAALRSRITDAMADELRNNGSTQSYRRMTQLLDSVHDAMAGSAAAKAADEAKAGGGGELSPGQAIMARLAQELQQNPDAGLSGPQRLGSGGLASSADAGTSTLGSVGSDRAGVQGQERSGVPARDSSVASAPATRLGKTSAPQSLSSFFIAHGGIRDDGGDLAAMGINSRTRPTLVRNGGLPLDKARELAIDAGFLPKDLPAAPSVSDINTLLDRLADEASGRKVYRIGEAEGHAVSEAESRQMRMFEDRLDRARDSVGFMEDEMGVRLSREEKAHAARLVAEQGRHPQDAIEDAIRGGDEEASQADLERLARSVQPGLPAGARQAALPVEAPKPTPTFDADAAARYQAARQFTAQELHGKFTNAPGVGEVLAPGRTQSEFRVPESQVAGKLFKSGAGGSERVQAYVKAGGDPAILKDYALFTLRKAAQNADGTLDPAKAVSWQKAHSDALSALEQAVPGFTKEVQDNTHASQLIQDATARAADRVKAIQTSAAGKFLSEADPVTTMGRMLESDKSGPQLRQVIKTIQASKDTQQAQEALAGVKQLAVDHILRKASSNAEAGQTGTNVLKSDVYQTLIKKAEPGLRAVFATKDDPEGEAGFNNFTKVAKDLQRANKSIQGTKVPGGSDTFQLTKAGEQHGAEGGSLLHQLILTEALDKVGQLVAAGLKATGVPGKAVELGTTVGGLAYQAMRAAGLMQAQELAEKAAFSPQLARVLLEHVPPGKPSPQLLRRFTVQLNRAMVAAAQPHGQEQ